MHNNPQQQQGMIWFGLIAMGMGAFVILMSADVLIHVDDSGFNAPRWVVGMVGFIFLAAGVPVSLMDKTFDPIRETWWFQMLNYMGIYGMLIGFVVVFNWVAFGSGERQFSGGFSLPFIIIWTERVSEWSGRAVFGLFALCMDVILLWGAANIVWKTLRRDLDE